MILDQADIDALLASATQLAVETGQGAPSPGHSPAASTSSNSGRGGPVRVTRRELGRILQMRFPVIVELADRQMDLSEILQLNVGSIIEFERAADALLSLRVGNRAIGAGQAVKVGEYFGLRVTAVDSVELRIRALGGK